MTEKCLTAACARLRAAAQGRGLCLVCYSQAKKLVEAGKTTWEELVRLELALPITNLDQIGIVDPFTSAFTAAKEKHANG